MIKINIVIDFDNTLVQTNKSILSLYREITNDYSTDLSMLKTWWFDDVCPQFSREQQNELFNNPRMFDLLEPQENAINILNKLKQEGHNLILCTIHHPNGIRYKSKYIHSHFPMFDSIIYIDLLKHEKLQKSLIKGDILLDDSSQYLSSSTVEYPICYGDSGWNQDWKNTRVLSWLEFYDKVQEINNKLKLNNTESIQMHNYKLDLNKDISKQKVKNKYNNLF